MRTPIEILQGDRLFLDSSWEEVSEDDVVKAMESYALQQSESAVREYRETLLEQICELDHLGREPDFSYALEKVKNIVSPETPPQ